MSWLQKNNYIMVLLGVFSILFVVVLLLDQGDITYKQIEVQQGDTLWSLAAQYKGDLPVYEWINLVKAENDLQTETIIAGQPLTIAIPTDAVYIAQNSENKVVGQDENEQ